MHYRHPLHRVQGFGALALAALCALLLVLPTAAANGSGTVKVTAQVRSKLAAGPSGPLILIGTLQNGANKKEWYYVYAVNGANTTTRGKVTIQSNRPWNASLTATQTAGDKKKMDLSSGVLHYSTTLPTTFAQAAAAPVLGTNSVTLATNHAASSTTFTHFFLLHVSQGSGGTLFGASLTYRIGQLSPAASTTVPLTLSFPGL